MLKLNQINQFGKISVYIDINISRHLKVEFASAIRTSSKEKIIIHIMV